MTEHSFGSVFPARDCSFYSALSHHLPSCPSWIPKVTRLPLLLLTFLPRPCGCPGPPRLCPSTGSSLEAPLCGEKASGLPLPSPAPWHPDGVSQPADQGPALLSPSSQAFGGPRLEAQAGPPQTKGLQGRGQQDAASPGPLLPSQLWRLWLSRDTGPTSRALAAQPRRPLEPGLPLLSLAHRPWPPPLPKHSPLPSTPSQSVNSARCPKRPAPSRACPGHSPGAPSHSASGQKDARPQQW